MTSRKPDWISKEGVAVGKGASVQEFVATVGDVNLEIDGAPWGEGHLKINGREVGHVTSAKDRRQAFRDLKQMAERYLQLRPPNPRAKGAQA
jgi:enoyl-[acyl-carrier protein] reductase I